MSLLPNAISRVSPLSTASFLSPLVVNKSGDRGGISCSFNILRKFRRAAETGGWKSTVEECLENGSWRTGRELSESRRSLNNGIPASTSCRSTSPNLRTSAPLPRSSRRMRRHLFKKKKRLFRCSDIYEEIQGNTCFPVHDKSRTDRARAIEWRRRIISTNDTNGNCET